MKPQRKMKPQRSLARIKEPAPPAMPARLAAVLGVALLLVNTAYAKQAPPCHPNPRAEADKAQVHNRGDIRHLPDGLHDARETIAARPHSVLPVQARAEADKPSQLFQYYMLDSHGFQP